MVLPSSVATDRAGTLDFSPVVSPDTTMRSCSTPRMPSSRVAPSATPSSRRASDDSR